MLQNFTDGRKKSAILVPSAAMSNEILLDLNSKKTENVENLLKDKMFDIDTLCQYNAQKSNNQNRVLVHCAMGMSRSATMVIMYLMRKFEIEWSLAFDFVKYRREIVDPNEGFVQKLKNYEGKQYKNKRNFEIKEGEAIDEIDELSEDTQSECSSSSEEDLMERRRSLDI